MIKNAKLFATTDYLNCNGYNYYRNFGFYAQFDKGGSLHSL